MQKQLGHNFEVLQLTHWPVVLEIVQQGPPGQVLKHLKNRYKTINHLLVPSEYKVFITLHLFYLIYIVLYHISHLILTGLPPAFQQKVGTGSPKK